MVDAPSQRLTIPPLENGDRLNRFEFERRYAALTDKLATSPSLSRISRAPDKK